MRPFGSSCFDLKMIERDVGELGAKLDAAVGPSDRIMLDGHSGRGYWTLPKHHREAEAWICTKEGWV